MQDLQKEIAEKIRQIREKKGITQEQLAEKLGRGKMSVSKYESGKQALSLRTLSKIADALGVKVSIILR